jgi:hypothetical protein
LLSSTTFSSHKKNSINAEIHSLQKHVLSLARDLSMRKEGSHSHDEIILCELVGESVNETGLSELETLKVIRQLIEKGKLIPVEECALVSFVLRKRISEYEVRRQILVDVWCRADEITILNVLDEERKEIEAATKLLKPAPEDQQNNRRFARRQDQTTVEGGSSFE